jgi:hypothetical protein
MSADRRVNVPDLAEFTSTVERLKAEHQVDELLTQMVLERIEEAGGTPVAFDRVMRAVRAKIDPRIVGNFYEPLKKL